MNWIRNIKTSHREHRGHRENRGRPTDREDNCGSYRGAKTLGAGLLEVIYEEALCHELGLMEVVFQRQVAVDVNYKDCVIHGQRLDLLVGEEVVVEVKSLRSLPEVATAQLLSYLKATGLKRGLLLNFGETQLIKGIKRISL